LTGCRGLLRYLIGHRGASGYEPENTMRSFRRAFEDGANAIEADVRASRDGRLVMVHDATVERTTDGAGRVDELEFQALRELDAGLGERIPTLEEVIRLTDSHDGTLLLEVKTMGREESIVSEAASHPIGRVVIFGIAEAVRKIHSLDPRIPCTEPGSFRVGIRDLERKSIERLHRQGLTLIHGDIDEEREMERLIGLGLDGIITNNPRLLARVAHRLREGS
jgi:glycerophosphoryl diester phosphodiesterase